MRPTAKQLQTYRKTGKWVSSEKQDRAALIKWLDLAYPKVLYKVSYGDDALLDPRQAREQKRLSFGRGWPDLMIYEPRGEFCGLAIELKKMDAKLYKASGLFASTHLEEQQAMLDLLTERGWVCGFAKGLENQMKMITDYLSL